jgi:hypothetical protein
LLIYIFITQYNSFFELSKRRNPDSYDYAGIISKSFVNSYNYNTCVVSRDLASLYRANFYMDNPRVKLILPDQANISEYIDECSWVIIIGNFQYRQNPIFKFVPDQSVVNNPIQIEIIKISESKGILMVPSESMRRTVGNYDSHKKTMSSLSGDNGALVFGPYVKMSKGKYIAKLKYSSNGNSKNNIGVFDVSGYVPNLKEVVFASIPIWPTESIQSIELPFEIIDEKFQMQFRVWVNGNYDILDVYRIEVLRAP